MNFTAKSKFNYKTIQDFTRATFYGKRNPLKMFVIHSLISLLLIGVVLLEMHLLGANTELIGLLVAAIILLLLDLFWYFVMPWARYRALGQLRGCTNEYTFTEDSIRLTSYDNGFSGESRIDYKVLYRCIETSAYFYIFQTKSQAFIVDKSTMEAGNHLLLRQKLQPILEKKYQIYKY